MGRLSRARWARGTAAAVGVAIAIGVVAVAAGGFGVRALDLDRFTARGHHRRDHHVLPDRHQRGSALRAVDQRGDRLRCRGCASHVQCHLRNGDRLDGRELLDHVADRQPGAGPGRQRRRSARAARLGQLHHSRHRPERRIPDLGVPSVPSAGLQRDRRPPRRAADRRRGGRAGDADPRADAGTNAEADTRGDARGDEPPRRPLPRHVCHFPACRCRACRCRACPES